MANNPVFSLTDRWGDEIVLTEERWEWIKGKHKEVGPYLAQIQQTLLHPNVVYEGRHAATTKVFYAKELIPDHPFQGCWVQVVVRYTEKPATISTILLPSRIAACLGQVIYLDR